MQYRQLGRTGLKVSALCLGTMTFGWSADEPTSFAIIGGMGEKKTLRLVAQYADACNMLALSSEVLQQQLAVLRQHCDKIGCSYASIEKTLTAGAFFEENLRSTDDILAFCERMAHIGFSHIFFHMPNLETLRPLELFAEKVIPVAGRF